MQRGNPAFSACLQGVDFRRREIQLHHLVEKIGGFSRAESQIGGAQLIHLSPGAQPRQRKLRILVCGDDQVHLGRQVIEQKSKGLVNDFGIDNVVVVKNKDKIVWSRGDIVEQCRQNRLKGRRLLGLKRIQNPIANMWRNRLQRSDDIGQKACGVAIFLVKR